MSWFSRPLAVSLLLACSLLAGCGSGSGLQGTWKLSRDAMLDLPLMQAIPPELLDQMKRDMPDPVVVITIAADTMKIDSKGGIPGAAAKSEEATYVVKSQEGGKYLLAVTKDGETKEATATVAGNKLTLKIADLPFEIVLERD